MHPEWATYLRVLLAIHIACGVVGLLCAPVALATEKGGKTHRRWGKVYFYAMAGVASTALILSFALPVFFLAMVAVFSFYSAVWGCYFAHGKIPAEGPLQQSHTHRCGAATVLEPPREGLPRAMSCAL